jgi:purine-binding chemotaxis protein CheW
MSTALAMPEIRAANDIDNDIAKGSDADADAATGQHNQYVTFAVAGEMFAVPIAPVQEIIRMPAVSHLPLAPPTLDGLANLRGRVLPIVNLRRLFGCEERASDDATRALVIHIGQPLGFVVDRVASVVTIEPGEIESADAIQSIVSADYLTGVIKHRRADGGGHDMLLAIDFARLIEGQFGLAVADRTGEGGASALGGAPAAEAEAGDGLGADELRLVSFSIAGQEYALDIAEVQEIVQLPEVVSALPNTPSHVLGVISLRQRLLPLVSLRALFGLPLLAYSEQQRIVVTTLPGGLHVGLVTDAVKEVLSVPRAQADPMPGMLAANATLQEISSICRLDGGKRLVSIIAADKLLSMPAIEQALDGVRHARAGLDRQDNRDREDDMNRAGRNTDNTTEDTTEDTTDDDMQVVIFRLGAEEFGVPIMSVQEIVRVPEALTRVPRTPAFVEGVINLRGTVLPVIDQRSRLGLPPIARNERQRIMVYLLGGKRTGFIVDAVAEVLRIPRAQIAPAPAMSPEQSLLISQVAKVDGDKRLVMLINPAHLLQGRETQAIEQFGHAQQSGNAEQLGHAEQSGSTQRLGDTDPSMLPLAA